MAAKIGKRSSGQKPIALALQGGGMHGAFTWGVLDRLLEDGRRFLKIRIPGRVPAFLADRQARPQRLPTW